MLESLGESRRMTRRGQEATERERQIGHVHADSQRVARKKVPVNLEVLRRWPSINPRAEGSALKNADIHERREFDRAVRDIE